MNLIKSLANLGLDKVLRLISWRKAGRVSPLTRERQEFEADVKEQFQKLKEKGLGIAVFTL